MFEINYSQLIQYEILEKLVTYIRVVTTAVGHNHSCGTQYSGSSNTKYLYSEPNRNNNVMMFVFGTVQYEKDSYSPDHLKTVPAHRNPRWQLFGWIWNGWVVCFWNAVVSIGLFLSFCVLFVQWSI